MKKKFIDTPAPTHGKSWLRPWPYVCERRWRIRWRGFLTRWRWPRIGKEGGLGGRFLCRGLVWRKSLKAATRRRRRQRDEYSNMSSMFVWIDTWWYMMIWYIYIWGLNVRARNEQEKFIQKKKRNEQENYEIAINFQLGHVLWRSKKSGLCRLL